MATRPERREPDPWPQHDVRAKAGGGHQHVGRRACRTLGKADERALDQPAEEQRRDVPAPRRAASGARR
eukprot:2106123-Prymnesium_polylepis.1